MITAIVGFLLTPGTTLDEAKALFEGSAPRYRAAPGLVRKYYLFGEDGSGGGVCRVRQSEQDRAGALGGISGLSFVLRWRKLNRSRSARPFFSGLLSRVSR
jgi:hypothetical protein